MSEDNTQSVAPTETAPQVQTEVTSAQDTTPDLDSLLSDFEAQTKPQPAPQPVLADEKAQLLEVKMKVDAWERQQAAQRDAADTEKVIQQIKGDLPIEDYTVEGWLSRKARVEPRINDVWLNRDKNPGAVAKLVKALKAEFVAEQEKKAKATIDPVATADRMAAAAAVRGTSTKAPDSPAPRYGDMTDAEFQAEKRKYGL